MNVNSSLDNHIRIGCPVCLGTEAVILRDAFDDRYGQPDKFVLVSCTRCKHLMTSPRLDESDLPKLYSTYYPRRLVNVVDLRREATRSMFPFSRLRRWWMGVDNQGQYSVRPGEVVLDVGCGSGLSMLEARNLGAEVRGVEADPNVWRIAQELGLKVHIGSILDRPFPGEQFDLVVLNQVIEHMPDPGEMLEEIRMRLKPGGRAILVFPNINSIWRRLFGARWINWHVPYHLHHFSRSGFERLAMNAGFGVRSVRTITPNLWTLLQIRASLIRPVLGEPSSLWGLAAEPVVGGARHARSTNGRRACRVVRKVLQRVLLAISMLLLSLLNRFIDAVGFGDSLMVEINCQKKV